MDCAHSAIRLDLDLGSEAVTVEPQLPLARICKSLTVLCVMNYHRSRTVQSMKRPWIFRSPLDCTTRPASELGPDVKMKRSRHFHWRWHRFEKGDIPAARPRRASDRQIETWGTRVTKPAHACVLAQKGAEEKESLIPGSRPEAAGPAKSLEPGAFAAKSL